MTKPTPHGQVPEALIDLIDAYAETRHRCGGIYNARTEAARKAVIEALSGVQALSAAPAVPAGWKAVPVNPTPEMWKAAKTVPDPNPPYPPHYGLVWGAMLAATPAPPAEQQAQPGAVDRTGCTAGTDEECTRRGCATSCPAQQAAPKAAPGVGNSGFDHQTAADFLSGKTVSDEAVRKFVQASRWAHDEKASLSAMLISVRGELASREAEIALLKKALLEAEAAPQQEAQEPVAYVHVPHYPVEGKVRPVVSFEKYQQDYADGIYSTRIPLYTAPQPAQGFRRGQAAAKQEG